jgi:copper chaperone CopZ
MRLRGRACEACALNLERKAQNIPGVRRATATFVGGVMTVTFDNAVLSPDQVVQRVRQTGAPVTPLSVPSAVPRSAKEQFKHVLLSIASGCENASV